MFSDKERIKEAFIEMLQAMHGKSLEESTPADQYMALARIVRDFISKKWVHTNNAYLESGEKQVYYFSLEFLLGRLLDSYLIYLDIRQVTEDALKELNIDLTTLESMEPDAGLGNGGLGRLAACFLDSMASLSFPGHGCGIRYKHGLFEQKIVDGYQVELPDNWLREENIWEIRKIDKAVEVRFGGNVHMTHIDGHLEFIHENYEPVLAVPYDIPILGYRNNTTNTLRLWSAEPASSSFDYSSFSRGEYTKAVEYKYSVEAISEVLYPDDSNYPNKILRLKQQYFFVSAGLQSIIRRFRKKNGSVKNFAEKISIHINDTHPALAVPEMMRILIDDEGLGWDLAWEITTKTISYTNHTIMPEALEKWSVDIFSSLLPRIYMITNEINERLCKDLWKKYPGDWDRIREMAVIADGYVKMANLAIVGSYSVNGVAKVHTDILKKEIMKNFNEYYPKRFNNKTNGITHRRWLLRSNPALASLISDAIGTSWITQPSQLSNLLKKRFDKQASFREQLCAIKKENKLELAKMIQSKYGIALNTDSIFDVQVKRIHAYKRQLLKLFHILDLYYRLKDDPSLDIVPRTFIFSGKAAPSYHYAKKTIKLINALSAMINQDKSVNDRIKVVFLENYNVSLAERIFPASDLSEQISTASKEASGTGNMKFMMNGAITVGTMDGANIEIFNEVGEENIVIFGLSVDEVLSYYKNGGYNAWDMYHHDSRLRRILESLVNGTIPGTMKDEFTTIYSSLLHYNDEFFVLKDFNDYIHAQEKVDQLFIDKSVWSKMSVHNIAHSGKFASDETIAEYASTIWKLKTVPQKY